MSSIKKNMKSEYVFGENDEFPNESIFPKKSVKTKGSLKSLSHKTSSEMSANPKRSKTQETEKYAEPRQKILNIMNHQLMSRKQITENVKTHLNEVFLNLEADYNALKENEQKLEHLTSSFIKCMQQATAAFKQKLNTLEEIIQNFTKETDEMEVKQKAEIHLIGSELEEDMNQIKENLIAETKRNGWEKLQKSFLQTMHNDFNF